MNILFVVVIALFYIVGNLLKSKSGKFVKRAGKEPRHPGQKLAPKPPQEQKTPWEALKESFRQAQAVSREPQTRPANQSQPTVKKPFRPRPAVTNIPAETAQQVAIPSPHAFKAPKLSQAIPHVQPEFEKIPEILSKPVQRPKEKRAPIQAPSANFLSDITADYAKPESLRRAILHYEILGKPLALRDPTSQYIGY